MKKYVPMILILTLTAAAYFLGLPDHLNLETLKQHRTAIREFIASQTALSTLLYIGAYIFLTAIALPLDTFLCLTAGFLFPQPLATLYIVTGALIGGIALYLASRTAFGDLLAKKAGPRLQKMERYLQQSGAFYIVLFRVIPIFPTWIVNFSSGLFRIPLKTFAWASFIGLIPCAYVYSEAGAGLGALLDSPDPPSLQLLFSRRFVIGIIAISIGAALLVCCKALFQKRKQT